MWSLLLALAGCNPFAHNADTSITLLHTAGMEGEIAPCG
jgi:hypothetical protein